MHIPLLVRPLTADERALVKAGLGSAEALTVRRCQILLASAEAQHTTTIAHSLRCHEQTVRNAIHAFHQRGVAALHAQSSRPHRTHAAFDAAGRERLLALLHHSPHTFGKFTSRWTLALTAEVSFAQGLTCRPVSGETSRQVLKQLGVRWKRAKYWITSPNPAYIPKNPACSPDPDHPAAPHLGAGLGG
jgi:transposase